jgi:hypothetical protein
VFTWLIILIVAAALCYGTWHAAEWACRRMTYRYAMRRRLWDGVRPLVGPDEDR